MSTIPLSVATQSALDQISDITTIQGLLYLSDSLSSTSPSANIIFFPKE